MTTAASLDISSQVDRSEITIGDRIAYEIKVIYPAEGSVELPSVLGNLGSFEVKDYQAPEPKTADNLKIQTWRFDLSTFTVGKYTIPPQQVAYRNGKDTAAAIHFTQPIEINVIRTSPETVKDIADIAPLADVKASPPWLAYGLGGLAILIAAIILWKRFRRQAPPAAAKPALQPFEEAMARLEEIKSLVLIRQNKAGDFCFILSGTLRRYISRRFGIDALESTTSEFLESARALPVTQAQKQWLYGFCETTDLVKFADALMLESDAGALLNQTSDFIKQTKPREEPPGKPGAPSPTAPARTKAPLTGKTKAPPAAGNPTKLPARPGKPGATGYSQDGKGKKPGDDLTQGWKA